MTLLPVSESSLTTFKTVFLPKQAGAVLHVTLHNPVFFFTAANKIFFEWLLIECLTCTRLVSAALEPSIFIVSLPRYCLKSTGNAERCGNQLRVGLNFRPRQSKKRSSARMSPIRFQTQGASYVDKKELHHR